MGLADTIASAVATAKSVTADLQDDIKFEPWNGNNATGGATFGSAVAYPALVEDSNELVRDSRGNTITARAKVTILRPVTAVSVVDDDGNELRRNPIDPRDKITLPDGTTGPILRTKGMVNPETGFHFLHEVLLG